MKRKNAYDAVTSGILEHLKNRKLVQIKNAGHHSGINQKLKIQDLEEIDEVKMKDNNLWICFPFSELRKSRNDPDQQGSMLFLGDELYSVRNRIIKIWTVPAVNYDAQIKYIEVYDIDIDVSLKKIADNLGIDKVEDMMNDTRFPVFVSKGTDRCKVCYCASNIGSDRYNLIRLQSDVERCLNEGLNQLDNSQKENWRDAYIKPFLEHVSGKLPEKGW